MKKIAFALFLLTGCYSTSFGQTQVDVNIGINVDAQPNWGPVGYDQVNYYYMPDVEVYYYVPKRQFIYLNGGVWVFATTLPDRCRHFDLYRGYKVVLNEPRPYLHHVKYKPKYARYCNYYDHQVVLREHRNKHEELAEAGPGNDHGNGHAYGHYKKDHEGGKGK